MSRIPLTERRLWREQRLPPSPDSPDVLVTIFIRHCKLRTDAERERAGYIQRKMSSLDKGLLAGFKHQG